MGHIIIDILRNSVLITGLVIMMMMMIESFNIESHGRLFSGLRSSRIGQVVFSAALGAIPGCMGGFASVSLYTHRMISFGALVAMMIASSGDEAFVILAMLPDKALWIFTLTFGIAVAAGIATDLVRDALHRRKCHREDHSGCGERMHCEESFQIHEEEMEPQVHSHGNGAHRKSRRHLTWKRAVMFIGTALFIAALASGALSHDHDAHGMQHGEAMEETGHQHGTAEGCRHPHEAMEHEAQAVEGHVHTHGNPASINLLSEDWMNVVFAVLSLIVLGTVAFGSDHFVEEHLWRHIVRKHLPGIFAWTFGILAFIGIGMQYIDISGWISDNTAIMIILATLIGIIPESGPHMIFVTLYASGIVPFPVLLASCISQDGHASIPLLAESKISFAKAKLINCTVALAAGFTAMLF